MEPLLLGKRALVTGASKGIGAAIAEAFAAAGADLAVTARKAESLSATRDSVKQHGRECLVIDADLATEEGARRVSELALQHAPCWDILVNNAGTAAPAPLLETTAASWDLIMAVNLRAPLLLARALVPGMMEVKGGKIINIASMAAFTGTPSAGAYAASKAGLCQLTRTMAVEWGPFNIQTNAICPTVVMTELSRQFWLDPAHEDALKQKIARNPSRRLGEVQDVADLALFLAGPGSSYLNGLSLPLDGGLQLAP